MTRKATRGGPAKSEIDLMAIGVSLVEKIIGELMRGPNATRLVESVFAKGPARERFRSELLAKGAIRRDESLVAFYNSAIVSPSESEPQTETCVFVTEERVGQYFENSERGSCALQDICEVQKEFRGFLSKDRLFLTTTRGIVVELEFCRNEVTNTFERLISNRSHVPRAAR